MVPPFFRLMASACVLAVALLLGGVGNAVAVASPGSSDSAAQDNGNKGSSQQGNAGKSSSPKSNTGKSSSPKSNTGNGSGQPSTGANHSSNKPAGTRTTDDTADSGAVAAAPNELAPAPTAAAPVPTAAAPVPAPAPTAAAPVPTPLVVLIYDVLALLQHPPTSVAGAVAQLTQLQSDLYYFLLSIPGMGPIASAALGGIDAAGLSATTHAGVPSRWQPLLFIPGIPGGPLAGNAEFVLLGEIAAAAVGAMPQVVQASWLPGIAPLAPHGATPMAVQTSFRPAGHRLLPPGSLSGLDVVVLPVVLPLSLAALAALALPGAGGLAVVTGVGVRLGYRQAKAGVALRTAGMACFARPGAFPLAVVHSGSLVVVRPQALRVVRPERLSAGGLLDEVA